MAETPPQDDEQQRDAAPEQAPDAPEQAAETPEATADVPEATPDAGQQAADAREEGTDLADLPSEPPAGEPEAPTAPTAGVAAEQGTDAPAVVPSEPVEDVAAEQPEQPAAEAEQPAAEAEVPAAEAEVPAPEAEQPAIEAEAAPPEAEEPLETEIAAGAETPIAPAPDAASGAAPGAEEAAADDEAIGAEVDEAPEPRVRPEIPGADLEPDIVLEGGDPLEGREKPEIPGAYLEPDIVLEGDEVVPAEEDAEGLEDAPPQAAVEDGAPQPIAQATIDLAAGARYKATGKRKTSIARVILKPGGGTYQVNGRPLENHFPRPALARNIRQPLETVGYESRMDVVATIQGGGVSSQAGALRHGIARALIEADPNLRSELKRRGFLTRDSRVKERKKAGLKKARKRPQFSKR